MEGASSTAHAGSHGLADPSFTNEAVPIPAEIHEFPPSVWSSVAPESRAKVPLFVTQPSIASRMSASPFPVTVTVWSRRTFSPYDPD